MNEWMNKVLYYRVCIYLPYSEYALNMPFEGEMKDESRTEIISTGLNVVICKELEDGLWRNFSFITFTLFQETVVKRQILPLWTAKPMKGFYCNQNLSPELSGKGYTDFRYLFFFSCLWQWVYFLGSWRGKFKETNQLLQLADRGEYLLTILATSTQSIQISLFSFFVVSV